MKPNDHAENSAKKYGGVPADYLDIHEYMDSSRGAVSDMGHRVATHHSFFVYGTLLKIFGSTRENSAGKTYSVADVGEDHCKEDFNGHFPTLNDWTEHLNIQPWMLGETENSVPKSAEKFVSPAGDLCPEIQKVPSLAPTTPEGAGFDSRHLPQQGKQSDIHRALYDGHGGGFKDRSF